MNIHYVSFYNNICQICMFHLQLKLVCNYMKPTPALVATVDVLAKTWC